MTSGFGRSTGVSWSLGPLFGSAALTPTESPQDTGPLPLLLLSPPTCTKSDHPSTFPQTSAETTEEEPTVVQRLSPETDEGLDLDFHLPRSSPVISRRQRPLFWDGGHQLSTTSSDCGEQGEPLTMRSVKALSTCQSPASVCEQQETTRDSEDSKERSPGVSPKISADIFKSTCELEKENVHFIMVDLVLEVLEGAKWTLSLEEMMDLQLGPKTDFNMCLKKDSSSNDVRQHCSDDGEQEKQLQHTEQRKEEWEAHHDEAGDQLKTLSVFSNDSVFEDFTKANTSTQDFTTNAEWLAQQLVLDFRRSWLPSHKPRRGRSSLRSSLQELPGAEAVVGSSSGDLKDQIRLRTRMRGSLNWTPPRFQIILTVQPHNRRSDVVALQQFLCAGCGTEVEPRYIKKLRYCEYLSRYFCDCCHSGSEAVIPARVLSSWDFNRYAVSDFSKHLLDSVWLEPLFDLTSVGSSLFSQVKELHRFRELQKQLLGIKKLLMRCRFSETALKEFEQLPGHLTERPHLFSLDDLQKVKKGLLVAQTKTVLQSVLQHVQHCQMCVAQGFICEHCKDKDLIFPFQRDICKRCQGCQRYFHKHCLVEMKCLKCSYTRSKERSRK